MSPFPSVRNHVRGRSVELAWVWYWSVLAISTVFLVATFISVAAQLTNNFVLEKLLLTRENNPAALWSGLLLALTAIHAYDGDARWRQQQPDVAKAWLLIALVLLILSADEIGSIHERVGMEGERLGVGQWFALLPFAIILLALLGYGLIQLWRAGQRGTAVVVVLGFVLLGSAALQEFVEHRIVLVSSIAKAIRATLEEGSELAGTLILFKLALANTAFARRRGLVAWPCLEAVRELWIPVAATAFLLAPLLAVATNIYEDGSRGRLADWLAVVLLLAAALAVCRPYLQGKLNRWPAWIVAGACGIAGVAIVEMDPGKLVWVGPFEASMRLLTLAVLSPLAIVMWGLLYGRHTLWLCLFTVAVTANLVDLALTPIGATTIYLVTQLSALAIYVAVASRESAWQPVAAGGMSPTTGASPRS